MKDEMKKILILFLVCLAVPSICFSQKEISPDAQKLIDDFFTLRMNLSVYDSRTETDKIIGQIDLFLSDNKARLDSCSEQEQLILSNFAAMERYNYLYELPEQKDKQRESMKNQKDLCEKYFDTHSEDDSSKWLICTRADVTSCYMGFAFKDVLKYGLKIKPLYKKALDLDPDFAYGLMNMAQWFYYAPGMTGGSKDKALSYFEKAAAAAKKPAEKYYADIFLSQSLFEHKQYERAKKLLEEAASFCPESKYIKLIQSVNSDGMSLFDYNRKKSSLSEEADSRDSRK